jgi:hypothetical protein
VAQVEKEITSAERIRRIIGILRLDGREVELHLPSYIEIAKVVNTTHGSFTLKLSNPFISIPDENLESVYVNFIFSGVELFGECRFVEQTRVFITLNFPEALKSRTKRRYPRIKLKRVLDAELMYREVPEKGMERLSLKDMPVKFSQLYWEAQRESVDIKKVFLMTLKEIRSISPYSEIIIYSQETMRSRNALIMRKSGKLLFIEDCNKGQSYTQFIPSERIVTYSYYLNDMKLSGATQDELKQELQDIIREDREKGMTSKVIVPIFSREGVVGHILLYQKDDSVKITQENISDLIALSMLLSLAIGKARFGAKIEDIVGSNLLDISEGGLLLRIQNDEKKINIPEGADIEVKFNVGGNELLLKGSVCRKDPENESYAVKFADVDMEEKKILKKFIDANIEKLKNTQ